MAGYRVEREVGVGGFGTVYEGYLGADRVALKIAHAANVEGLRLMRRESEVLRRVGPPLVPEIRGFGVTDSGRFAYLAMEWMEADCLATRMLDIGGPMSIAEFGVLAPAIISAVGALHERGVVHRDLKPEHLILSWGPRGLRVRLLDLGLAIRLSVRPFRPAEVYGTSGYMAPEQVERDVITAKADIYALGVIMYEMLSGDLPFGGTSSEQLLAHISTPPPPVTSRLRVPAPIERVIRRCLHKDPDARYASAETLCRSMLRALASAGM